MPGAPETISFSPALPSAWQAAHITALATAGVAHQTIAPITEALAPVLPGIDLWDLWPLQLADGSTADVGGWNLWFVLSAPVLPDPDDRHDIARIRLMGRPAGAIDKGLIDLGNALPDGLNPGSREWAGSALYDPASGAVTLYYTVAGFPGEATRSFAQRLFHTTGTLITADKPHITGWSTPQELFASDDNHYVLVTQSDGVPGFIKGFRDPAHFRDPVTGDSYMLFTGSLKASQHAFNGCIGIARADASHPTGWQILPPIISADGLNNELERPILIHRDGQYYLFWSTQRRVFAPDGPSGPTGLYGMVAPTLGGPWAPLNGTGLVAGNPDDAPYQTYSWWVDADLNVWGFADLPGVAEGGQVDDSAWRRAHFAGTPAPCFTIMLDGTKAWVAR